MKTIPISGVIGYDVSPSDIRKALAEAKGEPLDIQISSPGGIVIDGLEIYNLIKNYKGEKTSHLMGLAASIGSYIALAGDRVVAEANAVFMIHNALGGAMGNHNDLRKAADIFEGFSAMLAGAYAAKTGKTVAEIRALMDAETFYFGAEGRDAGFIDEMIGEPTGDKATAILTAKALRASCDEVVRTFTDDESTARLAAYLPLSPAGVASSAAATSAAISKSKESTMDITQLKAEHPDLVAKISAEAEQVGIDKERTRRNAIAQFRGVNPDGDKAVEEAIASGASAQDASLTIQAAILKGKSPQADGENAPEIHAKTPDTGSGASAMSAEDRAWYAKHGVSEDEIKKLAAAAAEGKE